MNAYEVEAGTVCLLFKNCISIYYIQIYISIDIVPEHFRGQFLTVERYTTLLHFTFFYLYRLRIALIINLLFAWRRFPNPREMIRVLKSELDFRVTLWVHPFASPLSSAAWMTDEEGSRVWMKGFPWPSSWPAFVLWWEGVGAVLDVTSPAAVRWFLGKLGALRSKYGVDSFKFDAGESNLMPRWRKPSSTLDNPNEYTRHFVDIAYRSVVIQPYYYYYYYYYYYFSWDKPSRHEDIRK